MDTWENKKCAIELTNSQWTTLEVYIRMTTKHRKEERECWEGLAKEKDENGDSIFKNAQSNAEFYDSLEKTLQEILQAIDRR